MTTAAANSAGVEPGIRTRAGQLNLDLRFGARRCAARRGRAGALSRRDQHLGEPRSRGAELLPPTIDLIRRNVGPASHLRNHSTRRKTPCSRSPVSARRSTGADARGGYLGEIVTRIVNRHPQSRLDDLLPWAYPAMPQLKAVA
jgi:hypothetical protein